MNRILLVEDQKDFQLLVEKILRDGQHQLSFADNAADAKKMIKEGGFDLILLDVSLPDQNGFDLYLDLQKMTELGDTPVIFLTGTENVSSKVTAFSLGAEDYITKSSDVNELKARVLAKVRKSKNRAGGADERVVGPFRIDLPAQRVYGLDDRKEIPLTPKEFKLLVFLSKNPDVIMDREKILSHVWGDETFVTDRSVDNCVYQLRKKLGSFSGHIEAVAGVGYRFNVKPLKKVA